MSRSNFKPVTPVTPRKLPFTPDRNLSPNINTHSPSTPNPLNQTIWQTPKTSESTLDTTVNEHIRTYSLSNLIDWTQPPSPTFHSELPTPARSKTPPIQHKTHDVHKEEKTKIHGHHFSGPPTIGNTLLMITHLRR